MRLERSAERDKREIINNFSAEYAQSETEGIPNRLFAARIVQPFPLSHPQKLKIQLKNAPDGSKSNLDVLY